MKEISEPRMSRREFLCFAERIGLSVLIDLSGIDRIEPTRKNIKRTEQKSTVVENLIFLPEKTEECEGFFNSCTPLITVDFPLHYDKNYNLNKSVTILKLPSGFNFRFKNLYYFRDPGCQDSKQKIVRATILPDTMGTHDLVVAFLDRVQFDSVGKYISVVKTHEGAKDGNIYGEMTYWVGDGRIYPNKILNLLTAFSNILEYQENHGPLKAHQVYSYNNLIQLPSSDSYILGYNSSYMRVRAGGVCAGATALANALYRMAESVGIPFDRTYAGEKRAHDLPYSLGPFAPPFYITDTTVFIDPVQTCDFNMIPPADCYISPRFCLIPNEVPTHDTAADGLGIFDKNTGKPLYRSDVNLLMNIAFTKNPPEVASDDLFQIRQSYLDFRESVKNGVSSDAEKISNGGYLVGVYKWEDKKPNDVIESIFPSVDLNTKPFSEEIKQNPYLQEISVLMQILNTVDVNSYPDMAVFLRNSDWYRKKQQKGLITPRIESGINQLSYTKIKGQPVQCVQWVNLLASLGYMDSPLNIGASIRGPNDLIPSTLLEGSYRKTAPSIIGGVIVADSNLKIEEIKPGDLFLIKKSNFGHVGTFLATKDVNSERIVLTTDSNREGDGRIRLFTLDKRNFDILLGAPPTKKIVLIKNRS